MWNIINAKLKKELLNYGVTVADDAIFPLTVSVDGKSYTIQDTGDISSNGDSGDNNTPIPTPTPTPSGTASDLFDSTGEAEGKLHIGDFVNYTLVN